MSNALENLSEAIETAFEQEKTGDVLTVLLGATVALVVSMVKQQGGDSDQPITIDGGQARDITIHPPKVKVATNHE